MEIQELLSTIKDAAFDVRLALAYGYLDLFINMPSPTNYIYED